MAKIPSRIPRASGIAYFDDYVVLGRAAPKIKLRKFTGIAPAEGASAAIAHAVADHTKIIGAQVLVASDSDTRIPPNFKSVNEYEFDFFIDATNVHIYCKAANSAKINGNIVTVLLTLEA